jgi:hypothetical protein
MHHNEGINVLRLFPLCQDDIKINRKGKIEVLQKGQKMLQKVQNEYFTINISFCIGTSC